ncbi:MAG: hypothetical protein KDB80_04575, partial [Planctomycetes bacterium]|nr:hypothetical protein [Planctomycetota bacterium]
DARLARRLHADFAHANSLTESESNWLWEVAQRKSAADPLSIFVVPSVFDALVDAEAAPAGRVRSKLFD